ncbi:TAXI family TRAP transporter solute-binding subunit [Faunimonas sp. B44]|uniref:TAXI family TRAP transporter solute-binding subunit n=1 Tax=Faunimonas sp. B44 TaxID=3461493 RepID=UPI004044A963
MSWITLAILATLGAASVSSAAADVQLNMGGSTTSSGYFPYFNAVANAISRAHPDVNVTVLSTGGSAKNQQLMLQGQLKFGVTSPNLIQEAIDQGRDEIRVLWWIAPAIQNIMALKSAGIDSVSDFDGKCFHPGSTGTVGQQVMMQVLDAIDVHPDLYLSDSSSALDALRRGSCLGQMKAIGKSLDGASQELNVTQPLWPVTYTEEEQAKVKAAIPWIGFVQVPEGIVHGAPSYYAHAIWLGAVATADLDETTVYKIMDGMMAGLEEQRAVLDYLEDVDPLQQTLDSSDMKLHRGAVQFYRDRGYQVPDRLLPPEMGL